MSTDLGNARQARLPLFTRTLPLCLVGAWLIPLLARVPCVPIRGWGWFLDYLVPGYLFISGLNLIPGVVLFAIAAAGRRAPVVLWFAGSAGTGFLLWAHGTLDLRSSSTAAIALLFIPIYAAVCVGVGAFAGFLAHAVIRVDRIRAWLGVTAGTGAVLVGVGLAVRASIATTHRAARFPVVALNQVPLLKRTVYADKNLGRVEVLALAGFDGEPGDDLAVLGESSLVLLRPKTYVVKSIGAFAREECEGCVGMYPYLIPDGKGHVLVASSDGVSEASGRLLWALKASGFTRLVPIQLPDDAPTFFSYQSGDRIERHGMDGRLSWSVQLDASDVGAYVTPEGERLPFAVAGYRTTRELRIYDLAGTLRRRIGLPEWASEVAALAWPVRGNLLVGTGRRIGVLDSAGREVLQHVIQGTSFDPYHGPDGVAVRFEPSAGPYLAVMSHGSSGSARSVLLVFDPKGRLVWQEELDKLRAMVAAPDGDGREVLLVGGMDGVLEYRVNSRTPAEQ